MTVSAVHKSGIIVLNGSAAFNIVGASNITFNPGIKEVSEQAPGQVSRSYVGVMSAEPMLTATVFDIATLAANGIGASPLPIISTGTITSVDVYLTKVDPRGENASGSNHIRYSCSRGMIVLRSAQAKDGSTATAQIEIHGESADGTTNPFTISTGVAIPTTPILNELFTVGPVSVNGSSVSSVTGIDLDMGYTIVKQSSHGEVYPTHVFVTEKNPKLTITSVDASVVSTFTTIGTALTSSTFTAFFRKIANKATRTADGTAEHVKIAGSASQGMIWPDSSSLQTGSGEHRLIITPILDSNPIIAISKAAIS